MLKVLGFAYPLLKDYDDERAAAGGCLETVGGRAVAGRPEIKDLESNSDPRSLSRKHPVLVPRSKPASRATPAGFDVVELDASFKVRGRGRREFRVVRVQVDQELPDGKVETVELWLVTNLPAAVLSAEQLATIYRLRWEVEVLFRTLKMVGRLDHMRSANPNIVQAFIYATLLGMVLAHNLCAMMRSTHPRLEPSPYRVFALLLLKLPAMVAALGTRALPGVLRTFLTALWREGINPNPGRPYRSNLYALEIAAGAP